MTEAEWLADTTDDPGSLLLGVRQTASPRKLRLFAVACCVRIQHPMIGEHGRIATSAAEQYADGTISSEALEDARSHAIAEWERLGTRDGIWRGPEIPNPIEWVTYGDAEEAAFEASDWSAGLAGDELPHEEDTVAERNAQLLLLRDIFGNPFRPVAFDPAWRSEVAVGLARGIYDDRAFERMPILADALQEAGCEHTDILSHCREPGVHVRGCWVVDLVLGKA